MGTVVDTSVLVALDRRHDGSNTDQLLATLPSDAAITGIQVAELNVGVLQADTDRRAAIRERFLSRLLERFPVLPFGEQEAYEWSRAFVHLRRAGQAVGERDLIIAATAMANGHSVMTHNLREFQQIPGLDVLAGPQVGDG